MVAWKGVGVAYVRRRLRKDGKTVVYLAMWCEHAQGKEQSKSFERKADAERTLLVGECKAGEKNHKCRKNVFQFFHGQPFPAEGHFDFASPWR